MIYRHRAFGLNILSEIECPPLIVGDDSPPDLRIRFGAVPQELKRLQAQGAGYQISKKHFLLMVEGVARYLVCEGREIIVAPYPGVNDRDLRLFLLGSAIGALLYQRGVWPLHGSSVATSSKAAIFLGDSGTGKSTLAGAMQHRGFQVLSDDVCAITSDPAGIVQVWPAYPRISLWPDSIVRLGGDPGELQKTHTAQEKYDFPVQHFSLDPVPVSVVYVLSPADQGGLNLTLLKGFDKLRELTANTYRLHFLTGMRLPQQHFQQAHALARQVRMQRVAYPRQPFLLEELANLIEKDMRS